MLHCSNAPRGMPCHNLSVFDKRPTMESGISRLHGVPVCLCCSIPIRPLQKFCSPPHCRIYYRSCDRKTRLAPCWRARSRPEQALPPAQAGESAAMIARSAHGAGRLGRALGMEPGASSSTFYFFLKLPSRGGELAREIAIIALEPFDLVLGRFRRDCFRRAIAVADPCILRMPVVRLAAGWAGERHLNAGKRLEHHPFGLEPGRYFLARFWAPHENVGHCTTPVYSYSWSQLPLVSVIAACLPILRAHRPSFRTPL